MPDSSSTIRMLCMLAGKRRGNEFRGDGQFHYEPGADGLIFLDANGSAMVFDDAADDGQSQSGSPFLGGEVRQKESLFQFLCNAVAGVRNGDLDGVAAGHQRSGDLNVP